jgi:hypothetical protein
MKLVTAEAVETVVRRYLLAKGFNLSEAKKSGETGCDLIANKGEERLLIEIIGFQSVPPIRSREFYELFFRTISRDENKEGDRLVMALPARFANGMAQRRKHYGISWQKLGASFPNLEIWYVDTAKSGVTECNWLECVPAIKQTHSPNRDLAWNPGTGTIGFLVKKLLKENRSFAEISSEVLRLFPSSRFNRQHYNWYRNRFKK